MQGKASKQELKSSDLLQTEGRNDSGTRHKEDRQARLTNDPAKTGEKKKKQQALNTTEPMREQGTGGKAGEQARS